MKAKHWSWKPHVSKYYKSLFNFFMKWNMKFHCETYDIWLFFWSFWYIRKCVSQLMYIHVAITVVWSHIYPRHDLASESYDLWLFFDYVDGYVYVLGQIDPRNKQIHQLDRRNGQRSMFQFFVASEACNPSLFFDHVAVYLCVEVKWTCS